MFGNTPASRRASRRPRVAFISRPGSTRARRSSS